MTAGYGRPLLSKNAAVFPTAAFFVSRSPRAWLVVGENLCFFILLFVRFLFSFSSFPLLSLFFLFSVFFFAFRPFPLSSLIFFLFLFSASLFPLSVLLFFHSFLPSIFLLPLCLFSSFFSRVFTFCSQCVNKTPLLL